MGYGQSKGVILMEPLDMQTFDRVVIWLSDCISRNNTEVAYNKCQAYMDGFFDGCTNTMLKLEAQKYWEIRKGCLFEKMRKGC